MKRAENYNSSSSIFKTKPSGLSNPKSPIARGQPKLHLEDEDLFLNNFDSAKEYSSYFPHNNLDNVLKRFKIHQIKCHHSVLLRQSR